MKNQWYQYLLIVVISFFSLYFYTYLSTIWVDLGGFSIKLFKFDYPLICILALLFYFPVKFNKNHVIAFLFPFIPIYGLYVFYDIFYNFLNRSLRISDIQNYSDLLNAMPLLAISIVVYMVSIFIPIIIVSRKWLKEVGFSKAKYVLVFKALVLCALIYLVNTESFSLYQNKNINFVMEKVKVNIKQLGRFNSMFYYHNKKREALKTVRTANKSNNINVYEKLYPKEVRNKPNIHIVVLEGFVDPRLIMNINYNRSPLAKELNRYLLKNELFSYVISPVYGGNTAQAEFELLTGVPAYVSMGSVEFNTMEGFPLRSFVNRLKKGGYFTSAMIGTNSNFFNSPNAYKSLGFEQVTYLAQDNNVFDSIIKKLHRVVHGKTGNEVMFDGDIYKENINMLERLSKTNSADKPILNYILGYYGHGPYRRNLQKRPDIIESSHPNKNLHSISNQFYYRTKSLAFFLDRLSQIDPHSIILVISDHLPPVFNRELEYQRDIYENIALFSSDGIVINISGKKYYQIPWLIWDILSESNNNGRRNISESELNNIYFQIMAEGMGL